MDIPAVPMALQHNLATPPNNVSLTLTLDDIAMTLTLTLWYL